MIGYFAVIWSFALCVVGFSSSNPLAFGLSKSLNDILSSINYKLRLPNNTLLQANAKNKLLASYPFPNEFNVNVTYISI